MGFSGRFDAAEGHALGLHADAAGRRGLAGGKAVDLVVHHDVEQIDVAAHGVDEVIAADAEAVAIAAGDQHSQIVVGQLHARGDSQRPAMQRVHAVGIDEAGEVGRAADAADGSHIVVGNLQLDERLLNRGEHAEIAAAGAPVGIDFAFRSRPLPRGLGAARAVAILPDLSLNHDFMCGNGERGLARELFLYRFDDVMRHEGLPIVFADVSVGDKAGFAAQVAGKLAAEVVLDDDRVPGILQDVENRVAMQRHEPADLEMIG